jgi:hypothetical protein
MLGRLTMLLLLLLLPKPGMLMFPPGRFPPITGRSILPGNVVGRLPPMIGRSLPPPGKLTPGLFPPIPGRSMLPGNVDGRLPPIPGLSMVPGNVDGRLPPIPGLSMVPGNVDGRLPPIPGRSMVPGNVDGRLPPISGRVVTPGSVLGRLILPNEGRSPLPREGRFSPIPIDGRVDGICIDGGLIAGRLDEFGKDGRVAKEGFEGSVVGREAFGRFPAPPNDGRAPPKEGRAPEFPPRFGVDGRFGIDGRALAFPNVGREGLGLETLFALGLAMLGILGRAPPMLPIFGRAPPPPILPIDGLAPPPPTDGLPPPPPPLPRCANAAGDQRVPIAKATMTADVTRILILVNMFCYRLMVRLFASGRRKFDNCDLVVLFHRISDDSVGPSHRIASRFCVGNFQDRRTSQTIWHYCRGSNGP